MNRSGGHIFIMPCDMENGHAVINIGTGSRDLNSYICIAMDGRVHCLSGIFGLNAITDV